MVKLVSKRQYLHIMEPPSAVKRDEASPTHGDHKKITCSSDTKEQTPKFVYMKCLKRAKQNSKERIGACLRLGSRVGVAAL